MPRRFLALLLYEPRIYIFGVALIILMSWVAFVSLRVKASIKNQQEIATLQSEMRALQSQFEMHKTIIDTRLSTLEQVTYAILPSQIEKSKSSTSQPLAQQWQKNRDDDLRKRLSNIQERLMRLENDR